MLSGGGTDDQCVKLAYGLMQAGQRVWIAGPDGRDFSKVTRQLGVPYYVTPKEGPLKLRFILSAAKLVRRERIQIVHGHHGRDIWPTIAVARLSGVKPKVILTRHLAKSPGSGFSRAFMLGQCDAVIAVSNFVAKVLREGVDDPDSPEAERWSRPPISGDFRKIHVIHGGIDTTKFRPLDAAEQRRAWGLNPTDFAFAVVGAYNLPRGKGQETFLEAAAQIHREAPGARFLIVGRGNLKAKLEAEIARLGLTGKVWLTPYAHEMPLAMNAIDCLVHPAIGTEALGLVVCEAMACGKPVIASALDGIPEAFASGGYGELVPPDSVAAVARAMREWAGRPRPTPAEARALHDQVEQGFSLPRMAAETLKLYRRVLGRG